jgi:prolyl 3-hydroxylase /prolyl 3,4-dihydroxylase
MKRQLENVDDDDQETKKQKQQTMLSAQYMDVDENRLRLLSSGFRSALPFPHARLPNVFTDESFLLAARSELADAEQWFAKKNDLYQFTQSEDLRRCNSPLSARLRDAMYSEELVSLVERVCGCEHGTLSRSRIDLTAAVYKNKDFLLCHDDRLEGRRVAFILYLVDKQWQGDVDGGHFDMFSVEPDGTGPLHVVQSYAPEFNTLLFFEVSERSYHQVREVISVNKHRIAIGGWFHGQLSSQSSSQSASQSSSQSSSQSASQAIAPTTAINLKEWINPIYLQEDIQNQVQETFVDDSAIELVDFLLPQRYEAMRAELEAATDSMTLVGPAIKQRYWRHDGNCAARQLFESAAFGELLAKLTNCVDVSQAPRALVRRFDNGCYTLMHDDDDALETASLDAVFSCTGSAKSGQQLDVEHGGHVSYVAGSDELLTVTPDANTLSLVYRDAGTLRFVAYVNHVAPLARIDISIETKLA